MTADEDLKNFVSPANNKIFRMHYIVTKIIHKYIKKQRTTR